MKNLHFYIQSILLLLALSIAVQIPLHEDLLFVIGIIEFTIGIYQMGMSLMLRIKLSNKSKLLDIHFFGSIAYLIALIGLGIMGPIWMKEWWKFSVFVLPWGFAIFFLVVIDELERARHYRL